MHALRCLYLGKRVRVHGRESALMYLDCDVERKSDLPDRAPPCTSWELEKRPHRCDRTTSVSSPAVNFELHVPAAACKVPLQKAEPASGVSEPALRRRERALTGSPPSHCSSSLPGFTPAAFRVIQTPRFQGHLPPSCGGKYLTHPAQYLPALSLPGPAVLSKASIAIDPPAPNHSPSSAPSPNIEARPESSHPRLGLDETTSRRPFAHSPAFPVPSLSLSQTEQGASSRRSAKPVNPD